MKKIINGRSYDTETAREVASWGNAGGWNDFAHLEETLYQKKNGEFFLFGEGGPMTKYAVSTGQNTWSGGSKIIPLFYDSAREWAEEKLSADEYESIFGEIAEDDSRVTVTLSLSASAVESARRAASKADMSLSAYIESLIIA